METKFCEKCGKKVAIDAVICPKCGKQLEKLKFEVPEPSQWTCCGEKK